VGVCTFIRRIRVGDFGGALRKITGANVLAGVCGMTCPKGLLCEEGCVMGAIGSPIRIGALQLSARLYGREDLPLPSAPGGDPRVAVIGAGPAGLACAYYLQSLGLRATLFEERSRPGGMLSWGIPDYRLAEEVVAEEVDLAASGCEVVVSADTDKLSLEELRKRGFGAVLLATGLWSDTGARIEGAREGEILSGLDLLAEMAGGRRPGPDLGRRIVIVGGGNTACDLARLLFSRSDTEVTVLYRRGRADMPAFPREVAEALVEGVKFEFHTQPVAVEGPARDRRLAVVSTRPGPPDPSGRPSPEVVEGTRRLIDFDTIIAATGSAPDGAWLGSAFGLALNSEGRIEVDPDTLMTDIPGLFAAGDAVRRRGLVVEAVADGRRAAHSIARYLEAED
jgi:NADPH-dependent glutamate synthase beta subunit-like oxidoreductase